MGLKEVFIEGPPPPSQKVTGLWNPLQRPYLIAGLIPHRAHLHAPDHCLGALKTKYFTHY